MAKVMKINQDGKNYKTLSLGRIKSIDASVDGYVHVLLGNNETVEGEGKFYGFSLTQDEIVKLYKASFKASDRALLTALEEA